MTTTFQSALTVGNYTSLRGTNNNNRWWGNQYLTLCKNAVVFAARVNGAISSSTFAEITFDTVTTGAYTDIEVGETYFLSHTNDIRAAYWRGRIREAATSTILKVNETSINIADNDYIFVVYDFDIWDKLSRMVATTQYIDWNETYVPLPPVVAGLQTAYVKYDPAGSAFRIAFNVSASYATDNYSTASLSYQFTFISGTYTVVSGSLSSPAVTVDFDPATETWGKLAITDSQGTTWTRRFYIRNHDDTDPPALGFTGAQITGSLDSGWNATVSAWAGVDDVLDQTFCVLSVDEYYNAVNGPLYNNIDMVGRFHREDNTGRGDPLYSYLATVKFEIEGICTQMMRLEEQDLTTIDKGTAAAWDEISFNTPQRSIVHYLARHSTVLNLCDLTFPDGFDLTYLFQYCPNQGGNVLDAIRGIAAQINANVEFAPDGRIQIVRDTRYLSDKSGVVVVGNFTNQDFTAIESLSVDTIDKTGRLDAFGASYNAGVVLVARSRAPGNAQSYAAGQGQLENQILAATSDQNAAQTELNYRAGQAYQIDNLTYRQSWKAQTGGYHFLIPSRGQRVTHTLSTETNIRGLSFSAENFWQITSITINHDNASGARDVSTTEELEPPVGDPGDTVPQIAAGTEESPIVLQPLDPFPALPDDTGFYLPDDPTPTPFPETDPKLKRTAGLSIYTDGTDIWLGKNGVIPTTTPIWGAVTPSAADLGAFTTIKDVCFDLTTLAPPIGAYFVATDGTDSVIGYTANVFAAPVVWTIGSSFVGVYTHIRSSSTAGGVEVYTPGLSNTTTTIYDFKISDYGWFIPVGAFGSYSAGVGWVFGDGAITGGFERSISVNKTISSATVLQMIMTYSLTCGPNGLGGSIAPFLSNNSGILATGSFTNVTNGTLPFNGSAAGTTLLGAKVYSDQEATLGALAGSAIITKIVLVTGTLTNANVRYSGDYGATTSATIDAGTSPGPLGAFDLLRIGTASLAAAAGQVKIATTLGGSYSNAAGGTLSSGNPVSLAVPFRRLPHGARQDNATDIDYVVGGSAIISSSCLWFVDGTTGTKTSINPVASAVCIGPNLLTIWQTSAVCKLAVVVNVSGVYKLYTSLNGGTSWTFRRNVSNPIYLRCRRYDANGTQLYLLDGATLYVSSNWGVSWASRTLPSSNTAVNLDIYY